MEENDLLAFRRQKLEQLLEQKVTRSEAGSMSPARWAKSDKPLPKENGSAWRVGSRRIAIWARASSLI